MRSERPKLPTSPTTARSPSAGGRRTRIAGGRRRRERTPVAVDGPIGPARAILVAVPARDEADGIAACVQSLDRAAARTGLPVTIVVAADSCHDDTVEIARSAAVSRCRVDVIVGGWHAAGGARRAAVEAGLARIGGDLSTVWIANTDGDCITPATWLQRQLRYAARGKAAVAGTVALDPDTTSDHLLAEFAAAYPVHGAAHRHVHGANLGVRADVYRTVGGWSAHTIVGEDNGLWRRLRATGVDVVQPTDLPVVTSSRTAGRVLGGFASTLARLDRPAEPTRTAS
jgi:Glycosyl transferase family 2